MNVQRSCPLELGQSDPDKIHAKFVPIPSVVNPAITPIFNGPKCFIGIPLSSWTVAGRFLSPPPSSP